MGVTVHPVGKKGLFKHFSEFLLLRGDFDTIRIPFLSGAALNNRRRKIHFHMFRLLPLLTENVIP